MDEKDELLSETKNLTKKDRWKRGMIPSTVLRNMKQHMQVTDKESGQLHRCVSSDIVILLPKFKRLRNGFCAGCAGSGGYSAYVESSTGYFFGIGSTDGAAVSQNYR